MSALGERKCALLLMPLGKRDRNLILSKLPKHSVARIASLLRELEGLPFPVAGLVDDLLANEALGLLPQKTLDIDQLLSLSGKLPPEWFARVIAVWPGIDRSFLVGTLDEPFASAVKRELEILPSLPPALREAFQVEAMQWLDAEKKAA